MDNGYIRISCLEVAQPVGTFYIGVIDARDLVRISYADIRRLDRELDDYLGIQRRLSPKRVEELQRYVTTIGATFPTSVILAVSSDDAEYDSDTHTIQIRNNEEVAKIIDGQHRIKGLAEYAKGDFQMNVSVFIDMDIEDQAMVFATINLAQTKVNKSLVYDLYEYTKHRSPHKTGHNIARLLNSKEDSPLFNRIKILGTAAPGLRRLQTITQATFVEAMIGLISGTNQRASEDRELLKEGKRLEKATPAEAQTLVYRDMFIAKQDAEIANVMWNYFKAISERWPQAWNDLGRAGNILPRTNGFRAFMRLLPTAYWQVGGPGTIPSQADFLRKVMRGISLKDADFNTERYKPGSSGEKDLLDDLLRRFGKAQ